LEKLGVDWEFVLESHAKSHRVSHETARTDLRQLAQRGLLVHRRNGRRHMFEPALDLASRLKESPA
jgi:predicted transcriptional regulator